MILKFHNQLTYLSVLSRYLVQKIGSRPRPAHNNFSSWARYIPDIFSTNAIITARNSDPHTRSAATTQLDNPPHHSHHDSIKSLHSSNDDESQKSNKTLRVEGEPQRDVEKGIPPSIETQDNISPGSDDELITRDQVRNPEFVRHT